MPINHEGRLWRKLNKWIGNRWWAARIESHMSAGIPDIFYAIESRSGWIELKSVEKDNDRMVTIRTLTDAQINWLHQGNAWLIVEVRGLNQIFLIDGKYVLSKMVSLDRGMILGPSTLDWVILELKGN